jgi:hypothetical protein
MMIQTIISIHIITMTCMAHTSAHTINTIRTTGGSTISSSTTTSTTSSLTSSNTHNSIPSSISISSFPNILPPPSSLSEQEIRDIYQHVHEEYIHELNNGLHIFNNNSTLTTATTGTTSTGSTIILDEQFEHEFHNSYQANINNNFNSFSVGIGNAGPDEFNIPNQNNNGHLIYQTSQPIISDHECDELILEAKQVLNNYTINHKKKNHLNDDNHGTTTSDDNTTTEPTNYELGEVRVSQLPKTRQLLQHILHTRLFPILQSQFFSSTIQSNSIDTTLNNTTTTSSNKTNEITIQDGLIIGYGYQSKQYGSKSQPIHRDSCLVSMNIALSSTNDYTNGGTFFEGIQHGTMVHTTTNDNNNKTIETHHDYNGHIVQTPRGHVTFHLGGIPHAGYSIGPNGERWVLVLFCIVQNYPEFVRRCHAYGMIEQQKGNIEKAKHIYQCGLLVSPTDHLLLTSLGRIYMDHENNFIAARNCLALAALGYEHCMKANLALGRMMLLNRKPRSALRRFDMVLHWLDKRDILNSTIHNGTCWEPYRTMGYDARYYGAQAALISAREAKRQNRITLPTKNIFDWRYHVTIAIERCNIALQTTPDDTRLHGMLSFANNLLNDE